MEARGPQKDMDIFLEVPRARIGILGLDLFGRGTDLGTFKGFPLADLGAWGGGRQGRSQRGPGPPAEDPCGGGAGAAHRRAPGFMPGFMPCVRTPVSRLVSWVAFEPGFHARFQGRFHGRFQPRFQGGFHGSRHCLVACAAFVPFAALAGLRMFGIAVLRLPASRMVSFYRSAKCLFACLLVAIGLLQQSAVAG